MSFRPPRGTDDIMPPASGVWSRVLAEFDRLAAVYGYEPMMTPIFEETSLFERGVGVGTDIVGKEMYTFEDRGGRSLTLRPEATAGVVRAYLTSGAQGAMKLSYSGPMFRYERPQAGRRRQFWQVGVEYLGEDAPGADVEVIELGARFFEAIGVPQFEILVNSLGDAESRARYRRALVDYLEGRRSELTPDSQSRIQANPLRVLDSKEDRTIVADAPKPTDHLTPAAQAHYDAVLEGLEARGLGYRQTPTLVRGLDYYTRTVFEYITESLDAAQDALGGGGRYDGLSEVLGGPPLPAVGFSLGIDRIVTVVGDADRRRLAAFVVVAVAARRPDALDLVARLRADGVSADLIQAERSVKAQFKAADRRRARYAVVVGAEWDDGQVTVRDLGSGVEELVNLDKLASYLESE